MAASIQAPPLALWFIDPALKQPHASPIAISIAL